ncbi:hypothetical protein RJ640_026130 [Escallonia rubra]|uniref:Uncharacterized protein n=1 Tax=Escallonia rubra TaxID=112253 RepID=A0AA88UU51_9ASTE|nr:hypothetical protein RJ640_026130 [Escallonia rubra]
MVKGSFPLESPEHGLFDFPGLRGDMEAIERSIFGGMSRFFEAAEEMKNGFFNVFGDPHMYDGDSSSSSWRRQGIPIEGHHQKEACWKPDNNDGDVDLSGLARDDGDWTCELASSQVIMINSHVYHNGEDTPMLFGGRDAF